MFKLDMEQVKDAVKNWDKTSIAAHQVAVNVMCGGSSLGRFAAEQPADFYIDNRVGRLPYPKQEIEQAVKVLIIAALEHGFNPRKMPPMPGFHNCGIF